ncbi:hypothetical protein [Streptomyces sirii]|uniref:hypothetical protein n=1 Tax=Streptomyces sirii TaxID=3127701 RepID=UPI003D36E91B
MDWTLSEAKLGAPRLHRSGKDSDPLIVLTAAAAERLGLPAELEDRRGLRLAEDHKVIKQLTRAKWQLTRRGFGPWARIYRPVDGDRRQSVQLAVLPWGALGTRSWGQHRQTLATELARVLGTYAARVIIPLRLNRRAQTGADDRTAPADPRGQGRSHQLVGIRAGARLADRGSGSGAAGSTGGTPGRRRPLPPLPRTHPG